MSTRKETQNFPIQTQAAENAMRTSGFVSGQDCREIGTAYCTTRGSAHYKAQNSLEPLDLIIAKGHGESFCLANIIKYGTRFAETRNLDDLKKAADYAHIACGLEIVTQQKNMRKGGVITE